MRAYEAPPMAARPAPSTFVGPAAAPSLLLALSSAAFAPPAFASAGAGEGGDPPSWGTDQARTGRYELRSLAPSRQQREPLAALVRVDFGPRVRTLGQAMRQLLRGSGFRLAPDDGPPDAARRLLEDRPLPLVQRQLGPMPLGEALRTLAGEEWDLVVDPLHRLVGFDLVQPWAGALQARLQGGHGGQDGQGASGGGGQGGVGHGVRGVQIEAGSLKAAIGRLAGLFGYRLVGWEQTLRRDGVPLDWTLAAPWTLYAGSLDEALATLLPPYGLRAEIHLLDRTLSVHWQQSQP